MRPRQVTLRFQALDLALKFRQRIKPRQGQVAVGLRRLCAQKHRQRLPVQQPVDVGGQSNYGVPGETVGIDVVDGSEEGFVSIL